MLHRDNARSTYQILSQGPTSNLTTLPQTATVKHPCGEVLILAGARARRGAAGGRLGMAGGGATHGALASSARFWRQCGTGFLRGARFSSAARINLGLIWVCVLMP